MTVTLTDDDRLPDRAIAATFLHARPKSPIPFLPGIGYWSRRLRWRTGPPRKPPIT
jgi:hypothetical protein